MPPSPVVVDVPAIEAPRPSASLALEESEPKHMPAMLIDADRSEFSRSIEATLKNSDYFEFVGEAGSERDADRMLATGEAQFVKTVSTRG